MSDKITERDTDNPEELEHYVQSLSWEEAIGVLRNIVHHKLIPPEILRDSLDIQRHALREYKERRDGLTAARNQSLYNSDILSWSEQQVSLLRRLAAGEPVSEQVDLPNIIEEIEAVGQSQVDAVESWLFQAFVHMLKAEAWPLSRDVPHWRGEARGFRAQARRKYRASMAQKIDLAGIYADALVALPETMDGQAPLPVRTECPVTLDELLTFE